MTIHRIGRTAQISALTVAVFLGGASARAWAQAAFVPTGSMTTPRLAPAIRLDSGKVLVTGDNRPSFLVTTELYDPVTGTWRVSGNMNAGRCDGCALALLGSGKVLVAGGWTGSSVRADGEIYDPPTETFTLTTTAMTEGRLGGSATVLGDGRVLLLGGHDGFRPNQTADLFDPVSGLFSRTGDLTQPRLSASVTRLATGKVLVAGGTTSGNNVATASAELYDPVTGAFVSTTTMTGPRRGQAAVLLNDGKALLVGGTSDGNISAAALSTAELYDPTTNTFTATGSLAGPREGATASLLGDGRVLIAGGLDSSGLPMASAEIYDPAAQTFSAAGNMTSARVSHAAVVLASGDVLLLGGTDAAGKLASAELFKAPIASGVGPPRAKDECKNDGWRRFNRPRVFKNQGDCVQYVNTGK